MGGIKNRSRAVLCFSYPIPHLSHLFLYPFNPVKILS